MAGRAGLPLAMLIPRVRRTRQELLGVLVPEGGEVHTGSPIPGCVVRPSGSLTTGARVRGGLSWWLKHRTSGSCPTPACTIASVCYLAARLPREGAAKAALPILWSLKGG